MHTKTVITSYHEAAWRSKASSNSKLSYLNIQATGLSGRPHPVLTGILTTQEVIISRVHVKMLAGDYQCYYYLDRDRGVGPHCRLCSALHPAAPAPAETMLHLLTRCRGTADTRYRIIPELLNTILLYFPTNDLLKNQNHEHLTQFILDPTSINLPASTRISHDHPALLPVLHICRKLCFPIHKDRTKQLKTMKV